MGPDELKRIMVAAQGRERALREAGQKEYAAEEDSLYNFKWVAELLGINPEKVLLVYLLKHIGGIAAWADGHKSQREHVQGRIDDARVYLCILDAMASMEEEDEEKS